VSEEGSWTPQRSEAVAVLFERLAAAPAESAEYRAVREEIIEAHLPLVRYLARRLAGQAGSLEDLVQVGSVGLIKAVDRFDPSRGHEFASYAAPTVLGEIKRYLRDSGWLVRAPRRAQELQGAVRRAREDLNQQLGRAPTISEIAERVGASADEVVETIEVIRSRSGQPLDDLVDPAGGPMQHLVAVEERGYGDAEIRADLTEAMSGLTAVERQVVVLRFAEGKTQAEIAGLLGVSQMQISRVLRRCLSKMRTMLDQ
jgi:RNA polymerase sigma-B factor